MFCEECGKKLIRPQALYCPYCGHKVNHEPAVNPDQPAQSIAPAPQTVSPESDAQGVPAAVSMQVSESPIESMPELQPIVPEPVEEAPAEEVPSAPEIPSRKSRRANAGVRTGSSEPVEEAPRKKFRHTGNSEQKLPEPMPELEPVVPEPVEEAPAEEVPSAPEIPEQETRRANAELEPIVPEPVEETQRKKFRQRKFGSSRQPMPD
ncbi:MAG: zinc ribbon domain-containing protein [Oscillospiraceae bacterium]